MKALLLSVSTIALLSGCATTRNVEYAPGKSGTVAVKEGIFGDARADADKKMRANCNGRKYTIIKEGESVIGHNTTNNKNGGGFSLINFGDTEGDSSTRNATEWRIKYRCK